MVKKIKYKFKGERSRSTRRNPTRETFRPEENSSSSKRFNGYNYERNKHQNKIYQDNYQDQNEDDQYEDQYYEESEVTYPHKNRREQFSVNSPYVNLDSDLSLSASNITDLDALDQRNGVIFNSDNIDINGDPFDNVYSATVPDHVYKRKRIVKSSDMTVSAFISSIFNSYLDILDDLSTDNYIDIQDLLSKKQRTIAVGLLLVIIAIFFVFYNQIEL